MMMKNSLKTEKEVGGEEGESSVDWTFMNRLSPKKEEEKEEEDHFISFLSSTRSFYSTSHFPTFSGRFGETVSHGICAGRSFSSSTSFSKGLSTGAAG